MAVVLIEPRFIVSDKGRLYISDTMEWSPTTATNNKICIIFVMYPVQFLHENIVISQQSHYFTWFASLPLVQLYLVVHL